MEISKKDFKLFNELLPTWQENYMERLIKEYINYLNSSELPSYKFHGLLKKINKDKYNPGVSLMVRKSSTLFDVAIMIRNNVITLDDISDFSDEFKECVNELLK